MSATAFADQTHAASRDARRVLENVVEQTMVDGRFRRFDGEPGPFARQMIDGIRKASRHDRLRPCRHLPKRAPAPCWVFGWRPGRLYCHRCAQVELVFTRSTIEDDVCDVCRDVFPKLWVVLGAAGPFLLSFGACRDCFEVETGRVVA